jgi:TetR/AcrR family transcriptional repressor of nem operon
MPKMMQKLTKNKSESHNGDGAKAEPLTRKKALQRGHYYLQTVGFNGFSFQDLANDLGIRKASLHYYFSSKEDLGLALIQEYEHHFNLFIEKSANLPAIRQFEKWIQYFYTMSKDHLRLCPIGVLSCELNTLSPKMQKQLSRFQSNQRRWAEKTFKQGIREKKFRRGLNTSWAADIFLESIQGGLQISRLHKQPAIFQKSLKGLLKSFC